jgi:hypothetical protein
VRPRHFLIYKHSRRGVCVVLSSVPKYSLREDLRSPRDVYHCLLVQKGILHSSLSQSLRARRLSFFYFIAFPSLFFTYVLPHRPFFFCLTVLALNSLLFPLFILVQFCHLDFSFYPPVSSCLLLSSFFLFIFIPSFSSLLLFLIFSRFFSYCLFVSFSCAFC